MVKHDELRSIGHNIADSLASGVGLLIGVCFTDVFAEAQRSPGGFMTVDFLDGSVLEGDASSSLVNSLRLYREALPGLCGKHGVSVSCLRTLTARYSIDRLGNRVLVTIEDENGRRSIDEYVGIPLRRIKAMDGLGRIRKKRP